MENEEGLRKRQRDFLAKYNVDYGEEAEEPPAPPVPVQRMILLDSNETKTMPMDMDMDMDEADGDLDPQDAEAERVARVHFERQDQERQGHHHYEEQNDHFDAEDAPPSDEEETDGTEPREHRPVNFDYSSIDLLDAQYALGGEVYPECYARPRAPPLEGDLVFQHVETTYDIDWKRESPVVRIWGVTSAGHSVLVEDREFLPYFYVTIRSEEETKRVVQRLEDHLRERFHNVAAVRKRARLVAENKEDQWRASRALERYVLSVEPQEGVSMRGYHPPDKPKDRFLKLTLAFPKHVATARDALEQGLFGRRYITYEGNVPFELRYMIDHGIHGCQWLRIPQGDYIQNPTKRSDAQYEVTLRPFARPIPLPTAEFGDVAPMRILSYDCEMFRKERGFVTPDKNPVIMICAALHIPGDRERLVKHQVCFALRPKDGGTFLKFPEDPPPADGSPPPPRVPTTIYLYDDERDMMMAWHQYRTAVDPDAMTGWNTDNFDNPYLAGRASALGIYDQFMQFSRIRGKKCWIRESKFESKAHGARTTKEQVCEGRFSFDGLLFMLRGVMSKFRSYTLNFMSKELLDDTKVDVHHTQIPILYEGTDEDRTRLLWYCLKDALLPLRILQQQMAVVNGVEQARVSGVPIKWLLSRGQGVKTDSKLLRTKDPDEHRPSRSPKPGHTAGGHVEEPRRGFYLLPIASLDFASLYPSIMIAFNICYTTKVPLEWARANLDPNDYWIPWPSVDALTPEELAHRAAKRMSKKDRERYKAEEALAGKPVDFCFVKRHVRQGKLPKMLEEILGARAAAKRDLKKVDPDKEYAKHCVLDGRQLALKLLANSAYGYTKGQIFRDDDLMNAVTSAGRNMLGIVKATVLAPWVPDPAHPKGGTGGFAGRRVINVTKTREKGVDPEQEPKPGEPDLREYMECKPYVVYGDTDSVMVCFGDITLAECMRFGSEAAAMATAKFPKPVSLAFEAVKLRALYLNRKRYAALQLESLKEGERYADAIARAKLSKTGTVFKGLESKRRDNAPIGGGTQGRVLEILLWEADVDEAERYVISVIEDLLMNRIDMSQLVITKGLSKTMEQYEKGGTKQQHVELTKRIEARALRTGESTPQTGDRVPYIMISDTAKKVSKACELAEDPLFALKTGAPIDTNYYIQKQILPAVLRVFTGIWEPERCKDIHSSMPQDERESLKAFKRLFSPQLPHMRAKAIPRQPIDLDPEAPVKKARYGIARWARPQPKCLGCNVLLTAKSGNSPVCPHCNLEAVRAEKEKLLAQRTAAKEKAWKTCRDCQGASFSKVTCSNVTCDNFFHRERVVTDLEEIVADIRRF